MFEEKSERVSQDTVGLDLFKGKYECIRPSEHPPVRGGNVKTFRWDHRLQIQNLFMAFNGFPDGIIVTLLGQHYNTGEKPTVILYTYYVVVVFTLLCKNSDIKNSITVGFSSILYY